LPLVISEIFWAINGFIDWIGLGSLKNLFKKTDDIFFCCVSEEVYKSLLHIKPEICEKVFQTLNDAIVLVPAASRQQSAEGDSDL